VVKPVPGQRRAALGLGLIALGIVGVVMAMPASADTRGPTQTPESIVVPGNPTCGDLAPAGAERTEPANPQNGEYAGSSHVSSCYDKDHGTTTTSEATTTTSEATTTTTCHCEENGTTTTSEATTTTTAAPTTTVGPPTTPAPQPRAPTPPRPGPELAVTGRQITPMLVGGGILLIAGIALLAGSRRLRRT
jgi:hypothetical protein